MLYRLYSWSTKSQWMALDRGIWKYSVGVNVARALVLVLLLGAPAQSCRCHLSRCRTVSCTLRRVVWLLWAIDVSVGRSRWCATRHIVALRWSTHSWCRARGMPIHRHAHVCCQSGNLEHFHAIDSNRLGAWKSTAHVGCCKKYENCLYCIM